MANFTVSADAVSATNFNTIQDAVNAAQVANDPVGSTITVAPGTYNENVTISGDNIRLVSSGGAGTTIINGSPAGGNGTIFLAAGADNVQIGDAGQGFTINGFDGPSPAIETSAVYIQGAHNGVVIRGNTIIANGDAALQTEYANGVSGLVIDQNNFSGQTFVGTEPATGDQFSVPNVARQLIVIGDNGPSPTTGVQFTNNVVGGNAGSVGGGLNGNNLVTIDAANSTITGNQFIGYVDSFRSQLRVREEGNDVSNNSFSNGSGGNVYFEQGLTGGEIAGPSNNNSFNGGAGNETIFAAPGNQAIDGGGGTDTYDMTAAGAGGSLVDLQSGQAFSGSTGLDTLVNIENVRGSAGNDALSGDGANNTFYISGGNDQIDGRGGSDTYDTSAASTATTINLSNGTASTSGVTATLAGIENATTGSGNDTVTGSAANNAISTGAGNDTINVDQAVGGVVADAGDDTIAGGDGTDTLVFAGAADEYAITFVGSSVTATHNVTGAVTTATSIEDLQFSGGGNVRLVSATGPYTTIQAAIDASSAGDIIIVAPGTYDEDSINVHVDVTIFGANAGVAGNASGRNAETVITGGFNVTASGVTIDGVQVVGGANHGAGNVAGIYVSGDDFVFRNSILEGNGDAPYGFYTPFGGNVSLELAGNLVTGWNQGAYFNPTTQLTITDSAFVDNGNHLVGDDWADGTLIDGNTFSGNTGSAIAYGVYDDIEVDVGSFLGDNAFEGPGRPTGIFMYGHSGAQNVTGTDLNDYITAVGSDDAHVITGGTGNDTILGGTGVETAVYDDATLTFSANGTSWQVTGIGNDGTDTLTGIEIVEGAGGARTLLVGSGGFATIQQAVDNAEAGDIILIADGIYAEDVLIDNDASGITLQSLNPGGAEIRSITVDADDVTVDGVTMTGTTLYGGFNAAIHVIGGSDGFTVSGTEFNYNGPTLAPADAFAIMTGSVLNYRVLDSTFAGYDIGMYISGGSSSGEVTGNTFTGIGNGVNSETALVIITGNTFDSLYAGNINLFPFTNVGGTINVADYVNSNTFINAPARPIQIYPTPVNSIINGSDIAEAFNGDISNQPGPFTFYGNGGEDRLYGADQNDSLYGGADNDQLYGNGGNDLLVGDAGDDLLVGGTGNDVYVVTEGDTVTEQAGGGTDFVVTDSFDLIMSDYGNVEVGELFGSSNLNILGSSQAERLIGNAGNNLLQGRQGDDQIEGGGGNDTLDGGTGVDTMFGGSGDDLYIVDAGNDLIVEAIGGGNDTITTSVSYVLRAGVEVELLQSANANATTGINLVGNEFAQTILGTNGVNILNGNGGADIMRGYGGRDTYIVNMNTDVVIETADGGVDEVRTSSSYVLQNGVYVEGLGTTNVNGLAAIALTGNGLNQTIAGNAGVNVINGGAGNDRLIGNLGRDSFTFSSALIAANVDTIVDFTVADDTIRLDDAVFTGLATGLLAANALAINSTGLAGDADDRIIYNSVTGDLFFDQDGAGGAAGIRFARITDGLAITNADFFVV